MLGLRTHARTIVFAIWGLMAAGLLFAIPGTIVERAFSFPNQRRARCELPGFCCLASSSPIDTVNFCGGNPVYQSDLMRGSLHRG